MYYKKNTDGTCIHSVSKRINAVIKDIKEDIWCYVVDIFHVKKCKYHCKAFPIYALLQQRIDSNKEGEYIHFSTKKQANFMLYHKAHLIDRECCDGKGFHFKYYNNNQNKNIFGVDISMDEMSKLFK